MAKTEITVDNLMVALHKASDKLKAARILNILFDMDGAGWTSEYNIIVETEHKMGRETRMTVPEQHPETGEWMMVEQEQIIWFPELCPNAKAAVEDVLSDFELPEQISLVYIVRERLNNKGQHVWPVYGDTGIIAHLNFEIYKLKDEINRIQMLVDERSPCQS